MVDFKKFYRTYLEPEDGLDWIIFLSICAFAIFGGFLLFIAFSTGF